MPYYNTIKGTGIYRKKSLQDILHFAANPLIHEGRKMYHFAK